MKCLIINIVLLGLGISITNSCTNLTVRNNPPNFIFIITDDISWNDLGCYGHQVIKTPNIDLLASSGMVFENFYLTASSCSPSRCSIITGRYPHNTGAAELHTPLPENQVMFPELLRKAGYYTVLSGKNHMGPATFRAFDTISPGKGPGLQEDWIKLLQQRPRDKPFFFWLGSVDAHRQWQFDKNGKEYVPEEVIVPPMLFDGPQTREDLAGYYHEVSRTDYFLGEIIKELEAEGVDENTYVIYMSDNGRPFPRCKTRVYDSGIKSPFIISGPLVLAGERSASLISSIDISSTILELAGVDKDLMIQGVSFVSVLKSPDAKTRDLIFSEHNWHVFSAHERMVRYKDWVYIRNAMPEKLNMCVESALKFPAGKELWDAYENNLTKPQQEDIFLKPREQEELFNLLEDPYQFTNIALNNDQAEVLDYLRYVLDLWIEETADNIPKNPTPDRETVEGIRFENFQRGEMPGVKSGGLTCINPGPILSEDMNDTD